MNEYFYQWIFKNYCDSDKGNYGYQNRIQEYGISSSRMIEEYYSEAIEDAHNYFNNKDTIAKNNLINQYEIYCIEKIDLLKKELQSVYKFMQSFKT